MHRAKSFCFVCAGLFLLALAYHLGARTAQGQPELNRPPIAAMWIERAGPQRQYIGLYWMTTDGGLHFRRASADGGFGSEAPDRIPISLGNCWK